MDTFSSNSSLQLQSPVPAVDDDRPSIGIFRLFTVDLSDEAEDAARLLRDAVVRPAEVLVVPHLTRFFGLWDRKPVKVKVYSEEWHAGRWEGRGERWEVRGESWELRAERWEVRGERWEVRGERWEGRGYLVQESDLQNSDFVISSFSLRLAGHHVAPHLLAGLKVRPVRDTFILHQNKKLLKLFQTPFVTSVTKNSAWFRNLFLYSPHIFQLFDFLHCLF